MQQHRQLPGILMDTGQGEKRGCGGGLEIRTRSRDRWGSRDGSAACHAACSSRRCASAARRSACRCSDSCDAGRVSRSQVELDCKKCGAPGVHQGCQTNPAGCAGAAKQTRCSRLHEFSDALLAPSALNIL